jgi:hypothetical protein
LQIGEASILRYKGVDDLHRIASFKGLSFRL